MAVNGVPYMNIPPASGDYSQNRLPNVIHPSGEGNFNAIFIPYSHSDH